MNDPAELIDPILEQAKRALDEMSATKDLDQRKLQSEIVKNLCDSAGVFFDMMTGVMPDLSDLDETLFGNEG
jgi:hypothetical protein